MKKNSKKEKQNKAFTMVELLGSVVILGILMMVAIPFVNKYIKTSKDRYYETQKKQLVIAAKSYLSNSKKTPKRVGDSLDISMDELVRNKYITEIKDANKQTCVGTQPDISAYDKPNLSKEEKEELKKLKNQYTFVRVTKTSKKVEYIAHLYCVNYNNDSELPIVNSLDLTFNASGNVIDGRRVATITMALKPGDLVNNPSLRIVDYTYNIYKGNVNLVEKSGAINEKNYSAKHDITRYVDKDGVTLTAHLRAVASDGRIFTGEMNFVPDSISGHAVCPDNLKVTSFNEDDNMFYYSFICESPNGCVSDVYTGSYKATLNREYDLPVQMEDKVDSKYNYTCYLKVPPAVLDETPTPSTNTPTPTPPKTGCPSVKPLSQGWTKGSINVGYSLSEATYAFRLVPKASSGWSRTRRDDHSKKVKLKKDTTFTSIPWNSKTKHSYTKKYTKSGTYYFGVRVKWKTTKNGTVTTKLCDPTYAYGPYKVDVTAPKFVSGSVSSTKSNYKQLTVKVKVKDAHSGIAAVYVNESSKTLKPATVKKKGKTVKNKSSYTYKKTSKYSSKKHTFYVHVVDRVGNYTKHKIGSKKIPKYSASCNYRSASKHGTSSWVCTGGHSHLQAYYHLCVSSSGKVYRASDFNYVCPTAPEKKYKPISGW